MRLAASYTSNYTFGIEDKVFCDSGNEIKRDALLAFGSSLARFRSAICVCANSLFAFDGYALPLE